MTQQEIQERNKQIALMLGYKMTWFDTAFYTWKCRFLYDWNILMEAVEFVEKLQSDKFYMEFFWLNGPNFSLYQIDKQTGSTLWETHGRFKNVETKQEAVFIAVSDFAKLYNNKKL